jgi:hypothetical protein
MARIGLVDIETMPRVGTIAQAPMDGDAGFASGPIEQAGERRLALGPGGSPDAIEGRAGAGAQGASLKDRSAPLRSRHTPATYRRTGATSRNLPIGVSFVLQFLMDACMKVSIRWEAEGESSSRPRKSTKFLGSLCRHCERSEAIQNSSSPQNASFQHRGLNNTDT